jgi:hypothetical protein
MTGQVSRVRCSPTSSLTFLNSAFPQIILNGELIGGLDIFRESLENGEWDEMYADAAEEPEKSEKST